MMIGLIFLQRGFDVKCFRLRTPVYMHVILTIIIPNVVLKETESLKWHWQLNIWLDGINVYCKYESNVENVCANALLFEKVFGLKHYTVRSRYIRYIAVIFFFVYTKKTTTTYRIYREIAPERLPYLARRAGYGVTFVFLIVLLCEISHHT